MGVQVGASSPTLCPALRTDACEHVEVVVLRLSHSPRARASLGPDAGQRALLADAGFVLEPDLDTFLGMRLPDGLDLLDDVFLKASWACGSPCGCLGRGIRQLSQSMEQA
jgi:hypothetical protein